MLRKNRNSFGSAYQNQMAPEAVAGLPMETNYLPQNAYKQIGGNAGVPQLDVTDPFRKMNPNKIPVPGTSVWTNPEGYGALGTTGDMLGLISSFDSK